MKQLALILTSLITVNLYGQDMAEEGSTSSLSRVQIGVNVSPDICYRTLKNNDGSSSTDMFVKLINENETVKMGYTAGLNVCFDIKDLVDFETGIQYSNKGYRTKTMDRSSGQFDPISPEKAKLISSFHYIDIPLRVIYTIEKKKVRFITSIGFTTNIFFKATQKSVLVYSDRTERKTNSIDTDYNKVNISPTISVGIDHKINSRVCLRIEPTLRYGVLKIVDAPVTTYLYSGGLNISCYYEL